MLTDLRYAARALARAPGFSLVVVLTLGLGLGASTSLFSIVNASLIAPLPFDDPERLVVVHEVAPGPQGAPNEAAAATFLDWRARARRFSALAAWAVWDYALVERTGPVSIIAARVSANAFEMLGVAPALGRTFLPDDEKPGRDRVVLLSDGLWRDTFGSDAAIVGRTVRLDGEPYSIVGVMPPSFRFPEAEARLWTPLSFSTGELEARERRMFSVMGRLAAGATLDQARAEMSSIAEAIGTEHPASNKGWGTQVLAAREVFASGTERPLKLLLGAVGCLLLVACANVAGLLLTRAAGRQRDTAIRTALGASRGRLLRRLFVEAALLSILGGLLGLALAHGSLDLLVSLVPENWSRLHEITLDGRVLALSAVLTLLTAIVCGVAPALQTSVPEFASSLREAGVKPSVTSARPRLRQALVVGQVAASLVLLTGAGLLAQTLWRLQRVDPGFDPRRLLTAAIFLPDTRYPSDEQQAAFFATLLERVRSLPGVLSAGAVTTLPMNPVGIDHDMPFRVEGDVATPGLEADYRIATPDYFRTMGIPLLRGREFEDGDDTEAPPIAIVNRQFVARFMSQRDPIGNHVLVGRSGRRLQIVGMVGGTHHRGLDIHPRPEIYVPFRQRQYGSMNVVLRTTTDPRALVAALKQQIRSLDSEQPITAIATMDQLVAGSLSSRRFHTLLLGGFAAAALALSALGLYGLLAHSVRQRAQEIGIRMAIGARPADVERLVVRAGLRLTGLGIVLGVAGALAVTRLFSGLLFQVAPHDPATLVAVCAVLLMVALLACLIPARRAANVDPVHALRSE